MSRRILIIISGGIAAYKIPQLIRSLRARGDRVHCLLTAAGEQFVSPLTLASLSGEIVHQNLFDLTEESEMNHITLARRVDMILVAPASANLIAKMAHGQADDLATTTLLATDKPIFIAPAMNPHMWHHVTTQRNIAQLVKDGVQIIGPDKGETACGESGEGRMADIDDIAARLAINYQDTQKPLNGRTILVTAGATREPIDAIRYIGNHASGKQGYAIAAALAQYGASVHLVSGITHIDPPQGVNHITTTTAQQMFEACHNHLPVDCAIMTAAVTDWRPQSVTTNKIKKNKTPPAPLALVENPDILASIAMHKTQRPQLVIGFAAETDHVIDYARDKLKQKQCDWIIANHVTQDNNVMGGDMNQISIIDSEGCEEWPRLSKQTIAEKLAIHIVNRLNNNT